jgi:single-strand DNA-binding protein
MSVSYSKIDLLGYVGGDPEPVSPTSGVGARFSLAVNRVWTDSAGEQKTETDWFQIVAWGKLAENVIAYLSKGRQVFVTGRPQIRQWLDKEGGRRETIQVVANQVLFLGSPETEEVEFSDEDHV